MLSQPIHKKGVNVHCAHYKYTNTKCLKDPACAMFLKSRGFNRPKNNGSNDNGHKNNRPKENKPNNNGSNDMK